MGEPTKLSRVMPKVRPVSKNVTALKVNVRGTVAPKPVKKCGGFLDPFYLKHTMLNYNKGTVLIPRTKWRQIYRCAKLPSTSLGKAWLKTVDVAYRRNVAQKMSKERALLGAIVRAFRKWKFSYSYLLNDPITQGLGVVNFMPPRFFLKYKTGACADFATLVAATCRHYKMKYAFIHTRRHIISAIVRKPDAHSPKDLKAVHIANARFPGSVSKGIDFYPIDVSPAGRGMTFAKAYQYGNAFAKGALIESALFIFDQNGRFLLSKGQL